MPFSINVSNDILQQSRRDEGIDLNNSLKRNGFHFDTNVVADACKAFGYQVRRTQAGPEDRQIHAAPSKRVHSPHGDVVSAARSAGRDDTGGRISKAMQMVKDMFPKIPTMDLCNVVDHSFKEVCFINH